MKILTLNTWQERGPWQERWEIILEGLGRFQPDLVAFQEVFNSSWAREVQKRTGFFTLLDGSEKGGLVLCARYPAKRWGTFQLTASPIEEYSRYALWAEFDVQGEALFVLNTHLSWQLEDSATRQKQIEDILRLIPEKIAGEKMFQQGFLLMGDLNTPPDSPEIQGLLREGKFRDLFGEKHPNEAGPSWDNRNPYAAGSGHELPDRRIDYLLARGRSRLLQRLVSCDLVYTQPNAQGIWATDHFGVLAELA